MKLSTKGQYAVRAMLDLALHFGEGPVLLRDIAKRQEISDIRTRIIYLDDDVIKEAFYVECIWYWKGSDKVLREAHAHDFDEVIAFWGTNLEDPHDLGKNRFMVR